MIGCRRGGQYPQRQQHGSKRSPHHIGSPVGIGRHKGLEVPSAAFAVVERQAYIPTPEPESGLHPSAKGKVAVDANSATWSERGIGEAHGRRLRDRKAAVTPLEIGWRVREDRLLVVSAALNGLGFAAMALVPNVALACVILLVVIGPTHSGLHTTLTTLV